MLKDITTATPVRKHLKIPKRESSSPEKAFNNACHCNGNIFLIEIISWNVLR